MLYDCKTNNQSQKRYTMDSLKEKDKLAPKPSKRPRIEVGEELMRQMIARGFLWIRRPLSRYKPHETENDILNGLKHKTKHTRFTTV